MKLPLSSHWVSLSPMKSHWVSLSPIESSLRSHEITMKSPWNHHEIPLFQGFPPVKTQRFFPRWPTEALFGWRCCATARRRGGLAALLSWGRGDVEESNSRFSQWNILMMSNDTVDVDGGNPAPVDRWFIPLFLGFQPSQVVHDFLHPP